MADQGVSNVLVGCVAQGGEGGDGALDGLVLPRARDSVNPELWLASIPGIGCVSKNGA